MVFGSKPKKSNSIKHGDNSDFQVLTGLEDSRFGDTATHTPSLLQLVAASDRRIHHGINLARDAIYQAGNTKKGCVSLDLDFIAVFDWLQMGWVFLVMAKKGVCQEVIDRINRFFADSTTTVVVNNIRGSLRQGDVPSMSWFGVGIDPLLTYLDRRLEGIPLISLPVAVPAPEDAPHSVLHPAQQHYSMTHIQTSNN